jgi:hypothetical protein
MFKCLLLNFVEDHPRNIPAKFGSNRPSGFGEEASNVKSLQTTDNRQYIAPFSFQRCLGHISCPIIFLNDPDVVPKRDF